MSDAVRSEDDAPQRAARRSRRRRIAAFVVILVLLALAGLGRWASRPKQVASLVLSQTGRALGLTITAKGVSEYRLGGMPQIVLRDVEARMPGDAAAVLRAERILLSMPWSTLRSRGQDLVVRRVELDGPHLDIRALQRWQATRPPTAEVRVPRLTDGVAILRGRVDGGQWQVEAIDADMPMLAPDRPARAHLRGRVVAAQTRIPFDVRATLSRPEQGAGLGVAGIATVVRSGWRLGLDLVLRGQPYVTGSLRLDGMVLGAHARYDAGSTVLPFVVGVAGPTRYDEALVIDPMGLALRQGREVPDLDGSGRLRWGRALALDLDGRIAHWPTGWPALPAPITRPRGPLPFELAYEGPTDLSGPAHLSLQSNATHSDARFHLPRILAWLDADTRGTPLPPLDGRMSTPRLEIPGATLHGVEIEIDDGDAG